jgi:HlyD family secretion protein
MTSPHTLSGPLGSIRLHIVGLVIAAAALFGGFGILAASTDLSGAVVSSGTVVVESNVKKVQHPTGGVVKELLVADGQPVKAGAVLIRLDEIVANANLAAMTKAYWELRVRGARLEAERDNKDEVAIPADLRDVTDDNLQAIVEGERGLFRFRRESAANRKNQLHEQIAQLKQEIVGLSDQLDAKGKEFDLIQRELVGVESLWEQKLISITRLMTLQREAARLLGDRGRLKASIAQSKGKIAEATLQIAQVDEDNRRDVAKELADVRGRSAETFEKRIAAQDAVDRLELRAPQDGLVHDLTVHTKGGVIGAGEAVMMIVPGKDTLIVETKVAPQDIDQVKLGQPVMIRFPSFNQRTTPELSGAVSRVSADALQPDKNGPGYFLVRVAIARDEVARLGALALVPGMPADVFIRTADRSLLSYLTKPLTDQAAHAFRER